MLVLTDSRNGNTAATAAPRLVRSEPVSNTVRVARAVMELLEALGEDPSREGLRDTPGRVARMYSELFAGLHTDPAKHLKRVFQENYDEIVLLRDIDFYSLCDRMGEKPLYYHAGHEAFVFGSELRALLPHPAVPCRQSQERIARERPQRQKDRGRYGRG